MWSGSSRPRRSSSGTAAGYANREEGGLRRGWRRLEDLSLVSRSSRESFAAGHLETVSRDYLVAHDPIGSTSVYHANPEGDVTSDAELLLTQ